jgi:hypothetical protein
MPLFLPVDLTRIRSNSQNPTVKTNVNLGLRMRLESNGRDDAIVIQSTLHPPNSRRQRANHYRPTLRRTHPQGKEKIRIAGTSHLGDRP